MSTHTEVGPRHDQLSMSNSLIVLAGNVVSMVKTRRERARIRDYLAARSERELEDMGICRASIEHEVSKPFRSA